MRSVNGSTRFLQNRKNILQKKVSEVSKMKNSEHLDHFHEDYNDDACSSAEDKYAEICSNPSNKNESDNCNKLCDQCEDLSWCGLLSNLNLKFVIIAIIVVIVLVGFIVGCICCCVRCCRKSSKPRLDYSRVDHHHHPQPGYYTQAASPPSNA
jgi:hypothetical protein